MNHEFSGYKKGKFAFEKVVNSKKKKSEMLKEKWKKFREEQARRKQYGNITSTRRRLSNFKELAKNLWCQKCDNMISLRDFECETQYGLVFDMLLRCRTCKKLVQVYTDKPSIPSNRALSVTFDVNRKLAIGEMMTLNAFLIVNLLGVVLLKYAVGF